MSQQVYKLLPIMIYNDYKIIDEDFIYLIKNKSICN